MNEKIHELPTDVLNFI